MADFESDFKRRQNCIMHNPHILFRSRYRFNIWTESEKFGMNKLEPDSRAPIREIIMGDPIAITSGNPTIVPSTDTEPLDSGAATPFVPLAPGAPGQLKPTPEQPTAAPPSPGAPPDSANSIDSTTQTIKVFDDDFSNFVNAAGDRKFDGEVSRNDLQAVVENPNASEKDRDVASTLLSQRLVYDDLGTLGTGGNAGAPENLISKQDVQDYANYLDNVKSYSANGISAADAVGIISRDFSNFDIGANNGRGKGDGKLGFSELQAVANDLNASVEDRAAASYLLMHTEIRAAMEPTGETGECGAPGYKISSREVTVFAQRLESAKNSSEVKAVDALDKYFSTFDTAADGGPGDWKIGCTDLQAVADNQYAGEEIRSAANYFLTNPTLFEELQTAANDGTDDNLISINDWRVITFLPYRSLTSGIVSSMSLIKSAWFE